MRREAFVHNALWWRAMPIGVSCLLHAGLVTGLILGQQWLISVVAVQPPVLPVQLVTFDVAEPPREAAPLPPPRRERASAIRQPEPARPLKAAARKVEEPAPQPVTEPPAPAAEVAPAPATVATLPAISEPAPAPGPPAPAASNTTISLPPSAPAVAAKPPEGVTQTARPQGGYQVRPAYPSAPRRLGIQGTTMLRVHVLADGRIGEVLVERSAGHPDLDQAATDAVRRWRFEPARRGADAVAMWVLLPVEFRLTQ